MRDLVGISNIIYIIYTYYIFCRYHYSITIKVFIYINRCCKCFITIIRFFC